MDGQREDKEDIAMINLIENLQKLADHDLTKVTGRFFNDYCIIPKELKK